MLLRNRERFFLKFSLTCLSTSRLYVFVYYEPMYLKFVGGRATNRGTMQIFMLNMKKPKSTTEQFVFRFFKMVILEIRIPLESPLKKEQKDELEVAITSTLEKSGAKDVKLVGSYYLEQRAAAIPMELILGISLIADLLTIALALREILHGKRVKGVKEFRFTSNNESIVIRGDMTADDITKMVREVKKRQK